MATRSELKRWRSLRRAAARAELGLFIAEGAKVVEELARSSIPATALLYTAGAGESILPLVASFRTKDVPCHELSARELEAVADTKTPQGIIAIAPIPRWSWPDLRSGHLLVLDAVQDPGNVGTLLRSAEAFGFGGAVLLPGSADPWGPKVTRSAAGSTFRLPLVTAEWGASQAEIEDRGSEIWAADVVGEPLLRTAPTPSSVALVLGNEAAGVSPGVLASAARRVGVPLAGPVDSLNVAIAGAVLMDRLRGDPA